jgi:V-type H+-transporting ATPase 16kDa proteolipid subunit
MSSFCPPFAPLLGGFGIVFAIGFSSLGAAYGTSRSSVGIFSVAIMKPNIMMRALIPVAMAGVLGIYGLVVSVMLSTKLSQIDYSLYTGAMQLSSGLSVGICSLAAGFSIGVIGDSGIRALAQQPKVFMGLVVILIFAEVLGLYGLIVGLILGTKVGNAACY